MWFELKIEWRREIWLLFLGLRETKAVELLENECVREGGTLTGNIIVWNSTSM